VAEIVPISPETKIWQGAEAVHEPPFDGFVPVVMEHDENAVELCWPTKVGTATLICDWLSEYADVFTICSAAVQGAWFV
jgi:hypothetical protein